ncbi:MAG TPA: lipid A-modifier LpxR family protein [Vicinamibacterales bacterium]|nr:lipid A-modifier LpxR family protein [Vicinamibacterales bacterium]
MTRRGGVVWALLAAVVVPRMALAQDATPASPIAAPPAPVAFEERLFTGVAVVHDNDNLPHPFNTLRDDNYSAAYEFRVNGRVVKDTHMSWPLEGLDRFTRVNRLHARGGRRYHSARLVGLVYTPDRIETTEVQTDDRPYASLVALTVGRTTVSGPSLDRAWSSELSIGMLGLDLPGDVQRMLHRTRRWMTGKQIPYDPLGWRNQISAGGEPTALYRAGYQRHLAGDGDAGQRKHWEIVGSLEGSVGYSVDAAGSLSFRAGAFTSEFWEFPRGIASPAVGQQESPASDARRWDLFAFGLLRPRVVAYDALLQGQFRSSAYTVQARHLLGEWEGGIGASLPAGPLRLQVVVQFAQGRTADYVGPKASRYTWGTVGLFVSRPSGGRRAGGAPLTGR